MSSSARGTRTRASPVLLAAAFILGATYSGHFVRSKATQQYPLHTGITATVFWIGEPVGDGSTENNALSAYDDRWLEHYGGVDNPNYVRSFPYFPRFRPAENPFYLDLPYSDFSNSGNAKPRRLRIVPWAAREASALDAARRQGRPFSLLKNRWVAISHKGNRKTRTCYGQIEDAGPYLYNDAAYVFGRDGQPPASHRAHNAGMDVSPALRDCLGFEGLNNDSNRVDWRFVNQINVPNGPWMRVVTTQQVYWP